MSILIRLANKNTLKKGLGFILIMTLVFSLIPSNSLTIEAATESENEQVNVTQPNNNEDNSKEDTGATDNTEGNAEDASEGNSSNSTNTSEGDADTEEAEIVNRVLGVSALDLSEATVEDIADQVYTGSEITPDVTVKYSDTTLVKGTDYTVTYTDNINVSTDDTKAKVTIEAVSGSVYSGSITKEFTITAANSEVAKAPEANTNLMYTAAEQALVTAGEANNGTMKYVLGNDSQNVPESGWSSDIPTGENEGTY